MQNFTKDSLPIEGWRTYRKKVTTRAQRIEGPFTVQTQEGELTCPDGYLAVDNRGWPYPITREEFEQIYHDIEEPD